ncbi:NAD(P)/FAD-dependent oxidoreductase [Paraburkholderia agricolaris]|uniref:FAD-dependent oxidoreductase n=1 Tax=Paraburkholderia agricolaris TaxID=2152888 RepID=UPI0038BB76F0
MQMRHVSIVGAGLGGLCLAQGLRKAGVPFDVYERDPAAESRTQGYRIRIDAHGQQALSQCLPEDLYALFLQTCGAAGNVQFLNGDLEPTPGRPARSWRTSGVDSDPQPTSPDLSANRQTLREILLSGIEDRVHFGKSLQQFEVDGDDAVRIRFEDGTRAVSTLLIGADGVNSSVRQQLAPASEPGDTGALCIYGKTVATPELREKIGTSLCANTSVIFDDGFAAILDPMRFPEQLPSIARRVAPTCKLSPVDDYLYWAFIGPRARMGIAADLPNPARLTTLIETLVSHWHPRLRTLFAQGDINTLAMLPVRSATSPLATWPSGPVTLLGDAIHAMSPAGGLGANTALRDAAALAEAVSTCADLHEAVSRYETAMRDWAETALNASEDGARSLFCVATTHHS